MIVLILEGFFQILLSREARLGKQAEIPWDIRTLRRLQEKILNNLYMTSYFARDCDKLKFFFP